MTQDTTRDAFHSQLRNEVDTARLAFETSQVRFSAATDMLKKYESFLNGGSRSTAAPSRFPAVNARPANASTSVQEAHGFKKDGSPRKKPGPPKGYHAPSQTAPAQARAASSKAAAKPATVIKKSHHKKPAVTTAPAATAKPVSQASGSKAKPGPRPGAKASAKNEQKPNLIEAMRLVIGPRTMNANAVFEALTAKGWVPVSKDPIGYIRYTLSSKSDIFLRTPGQRGVYHLDPSTIGTSSARPAAAKKTANGNSIKKAEFSAPEAQVSSTSDAQKDVEDILNANGVNLSGANPFAG